MLRFVLQIWFHIINLHTSIYLRANRKKRIDKLSAYFVTNENTEVGKREKLLNLDDKTEIFSQLFVSHFQIFSRQYVIRIRNTKKRPDRNVKWRLKKLKLKHHSFVGKRGEWDMKMKKGIQTTKLCRSRIFILFYFYLPFNNDLKRIKSQIWIQFSLWSHQHFFSVTSMHTDTNELFVYTSALIRIPLSIRAGRLLPKTFMLCMGIFLIYVHVLMWNGWERSTQNDKGD